MFCPKCGSLLKPKKEGAKTVLLCSCGFKTTNLESARIRDIPSKEGKKVEIVEAEKETLPLTDTECPTCHHKKAYFWEVQTRAADEPATKFLKCEKCKHIWRDYD